MSIFFLFLFHILCNPFGTIVATHVENQIAGVLSLMRNTVPDLITNGYVSVSASHHYDINSYPSTCLVQIPSTTYWHSLNTPGEWFQIDFESMKVYCTHYSLRNRGSMEHCLKAWKLEGSNDGVSWTMLHNQPSANIFSSPFQIVSFVCTSPGEYSKFRITMTDKDSTGVYYFMLASVDFFGVLNGVEVTSTSTSSSESKQCFVTHSFFTCYIFNSSISLIHFFLPFLLLSSSISFIHSRDQHDLTEQWKSISFTMQYFFS